MLKQRMFNISPPILQKHFTLYKFISRFPRNATSIFVTNISHLMWIIWKNKNRKGNLTLRTLYHGCFEGKSHPVGFATLASDHNNDKDQPLINFPNKWYKENYISSRIKVIFLLTVQKLISLCLFDETSFTQILYFSLSN